MAWITRGVFQDAEIHLFRHESLLPTRPHDWVSFCSKTSNGLWYWSLQSLKNLKLLCMLSSQWVLYGILVQFCKDSRPGASFRARQSTLDFSPPVEDLRYFLPTVWASAAEEAVSE